MQVGRLLVNNGKQNGGAVLQPKFYIFRFFLNLKIALSGCFLSRSLVEVLSGDER
jgi:hypothetical protein